MLFRRPGTPRRRKLVILIQALVLLALFLGLRMWAHRDMVSGPAPEITTHLISGENFSTRDYKGKAWMLHFWADWCAICKAEQGAIPSVAEHWPVITVAMQSGSRPDVEDYLRNRSLDWNTIVDESGALAKRYGVTAVPATFIIDSDGIIRFSEMGYSTSWGLRFRLWLTNNIY